MRPTFLIIHCIQWISVKFHSKTVAIYGAINLGAINLLLPKMEQFYGAIIWYHLMAPFYSMCVPGIRLGCVLYSIAYYILSFTVHWLHIKFKLACITKHLFYSVWSTKQDWLKVGVFKMRWLNLMASIKSSIRWSVVFWNRSDTQSAYLHSLLKHYVQSCTFHSSD